MKCRRTLLVGVKIMILQSSIRFVSRKCLDFFDHYTPLTDRSLAEAARLAGFKVEKCIQKFLSYTAKRKLPKSPKMLSLYLKLAVTWPLLGTQAIFSGRKA